MLRGSRVFLTAFVWILACGLAIPAVADDLTDLRATLEEHFLLLPLSDGVLLQPLETGSGPRAIEVSEGEVALDGEEAGRDEIRARLGAERAGLVLALSELESGALRTLMDDAARMIEPVAPPAPLPAADPVPEATADAQGPPPSRPGAAAPGPPPAPRSERPERPRRRHRRSKDTEVVVARSLTIERDEVAEDVVVFGGFLKVEGRVEGDATVIGGSANIEGEVTGDVTAIGGPVRLEDGSHVHGSVVSVGSEVYQDDSARVDGDIEQVPFKSDLSFAPWLDWVRWDKQRSHSYDFDFSPWSWWSGVGWKLVWLLFLVALAWLSLLIFRGPVERMEQRIATEPWKAGLVGLLAVALFVPLLILLCLFLAISIIGIPLLIVVPFGVVALLVVAWLGFVAAAGRLGAWTEQRFNWNLGSPFWVVLVGLGMIVALSFVGEALNFGALRFLAGMFLFFGGLVWFAAWATGVGAAVLTRFGTSESWNRAEHFVVPLPPVPDPAAGPAVEEAYEADAGDAQEPWNDDLLSGDPGDSADPGDPGDPGDEGDEGETK